MDAILIFIIRMIWVIRKPKKLSVTKGIPGWKGSHDRACSGESSVISQFTAYFPLTTSNQTICVITQWLLHRTRFRVKLRAFNLQYTCNSTIAVRKACTSCSTTSRASEHQCCKHLRRNSVQDSVLARPFMRGFPPLDCTHTPLDNC